MLRKIMVVLALVVICATMVKAENYAVIICHNKYSAPNRWYDTFLWWEALYTSGWKNENIHVLYANGSDFDNFENPRYKASRYSSWGITQITDDSAYYQDVVDVFNELSQVMTSQDMLFVFTFGDGGIYGRHSFLQLMDCFIRDDTFDSLTSLCSYEKRVVVMSQCYSGGFIDDMADANTYIMTACSTSTEAYVCDNYLPDGQDELENEFYSGDSSYYEHFEMSYHALNALRQRTNIGNPLPDPDLDHNGLTSLSEVWHWVDSTMTGRLPGHFYNPDPQKSDLGGIGSSTYLNIPPYPPTGFAGQRVQNHVVLSWNRNGEFDLDHYNVYKKTYNDSTQTYSNWYLLAQTDCTTYTDWNFVPNYAGSDTVWYKIAAVDSAGQRSEYSPTVSAPGEIRPQSEGSSLAAVAPQEFLSFKNYPDPFKSETTIRFTLPEASFATLNVYDVAGRKVTELIKGFQTAGSHAAVFFAQSLASGVYICRLQYGNKVLTQKMVLLN